MRKDDKKALLKTIKEQESEIQELNNKLEENSHLKKFIKSLEDKFFQNNNKLDSPKNKYNDFKEEFYKEHLIESIKCKRGKEQKQLINLLMEKHIKDKEIDGLKNHIPERGYIKLMVKNTSQAYQTSQEVYMFINVILIGFSIFFWIISLKEGYTVSNNEGFIAALLTSISLLFKPLSIKLLSMTKMKHIKKLEDISKKQIEYNEKEKVFKEEF